MCGATHSWPHSPVFSFSSVPFRPSFSPFDSDPPTIPGVQSLLLGRNARDYPGPSAACKKKSKRRREREREREGDEAGREPVRRQQFFFFSFFRFHRRGFLEQAASRWTPPGFGNVSIRDSTGRWTEIPSRKERRRQSEREERGERAGSFCEQAVASILSPPLTVHRTTVNRREFEFKTDSAEIPDSAPSLCSRERLHPRPAGESQESLSHLRLSARLSLRVRCLVYPYVPLWLLNLNRFVLERMRISAAAFRDKVVVRGTASYPPRRSDI